MSAYTPPLFGFEQTHDTSDDYYTPRWLFDTMDLRFDVDVCAPPGGVPWIPADRVLTKEEDGLATVWEGRVWLNPPFSTAKPWIKKFIAHRWGVCLVQVSKGMYSNELWDSADGVVFLRHIDFIIGRTDQRSDVYMPLWLAAFGDECVDALSRVGVLRRLR